MQVVKRQQRPFVDRKKIGELGEEIVINYFKDKGIQFEDMRDDKQCQKDEIDFYTYINSKRLTVEVKASESNIYKYNSIMVKLHTEYDDEKERAKRGDDAYLFRTKADYIFYVCLITNDIIIVDTKKLRGYINANLHNLLIKTYQDNERDLSLSRYSRKNTVAYVNISNMPRGSIKRIITNYKYSIDNINLSSKRQ